MVLLSGRELKSGIPVFDENGTRIGDSQKAAQRAIPMVVFSRISMATPGMGMSKVINAVKMFVLFFIYF